MYLLLDSLISFQVKINNFNVRFVAVVKKAIEKVLPYLTLNVHYDNLVDLIAEAYTLL